MPRVLIHSKSTNKIWIFLWHLLELQWTLPPESGWPNQLGGISNKLVPHLFYFFCMKISNQAIDMSTECLHICVNSKCSHHQGNSDINKSWGGIRQTLTYLSKHCINTQILYCKIVSEYYCVHQSVLLRYRVGCLGLNCVGNNLTNIAEYLYGT